MRSLVLAAGIVFGLLAAVAESLRAQTAPSSFATQIVSYQPGAGAGSYNDPGKALGAPKGAGGSSGSVDVVSLGAGGSLTLGFDAPLMDGPGADFMVFENPFFMGHGLDCFAEVFFVEVSSDGQNFARFPASYVGPQSSGPFSVAPIGSWSGLGGATPVYAHGVLYPGIDPRDAARAGGDAFDLSDLREDPLVKAGKVLLYRITQIRFVDIIDGTQRDVQNRLIRDPSHGSADIDGVAVLHFLGGQDPRAPEAHLELTPQRTLRLALSDADGLLDLDPSKLHMSMQSLPFDFWGFVSLCRVIKLDATSLELESLWQVPQGLPIKLSLSVRDLGGRIASDSVVLH
jgi:hypothetical protein